MDALTHAIEAYVNPGNTPFTRMFATRAIQQISMNLRQAVNGPDRPSALRNMLYAADIAGQSMSQGLGQVHGLSHVVSGRLGTPHGVANAILLSASDASKLTGAVDEAVARDFSATPGFQRVDVH